MQSSGTIIKALLSARSVLEPLINQRIAGLKSFAIPTKFEDHDIPDRKRLRVIQRAPQYPPGTRPIRMQKKLRLMRGPEEYHNTLLYKQYGVVARGGGRLEYKHFEMMRYALLRRTFKHVNNIFGVWRTPDPWQPVTKKGQGMRMGGGKGAIDHYVTPVKSGQIILELAGPVDYFEVKHTLENIASRLPFAAQAISYEEMLKAEEKERMMEEENLNPWTWKYIIQNKMLGCHNWISPYDKRWFMKYL